MENSNEGEPLPKRKAGRPKGLPKGGRALTPLGELSRWDNYTTPPKMDYRYEDIETLVGRQLSMVGLAQDRVRQEMLGATIDGKPGKISHCITLDDVERLNDLSNALVRSIDAMQRATKVADELRSKLTPDQVLEAAIQKIMAQDTTTLADIVKRLTYRRRKDPKSAQHMNKTVAAADSIASLED